MDREKFLKTLRERIDIVEVVGRYVDLKKSGKNFKGKCPFHPDKNPSFVVSPQLQRYRCFGCGASGDVFDFLMRMEGITFREAVEILAREAGMEVPRFSRLKSEELSHKKDLLYAVMEEAKEIYREALMKNEDALDYLFSRGLSLEEIDLWEIGYAPGGDFLKSRLKEKGYEDGVLLEAGLITSRSIDFFQERIVIPIKNPSGKVVSFGGRVLGKDFADVPKYINTPNSPIYDKSSTLFGLDVALKESSVQSSFGGFRKVPLAVLMEGYFDVIIAHSKGVSGAVATSGTAFTDKHAYILKRYSSRVSILYDGDGAGMKGAIKAASALLSAGFTEEEIVLIFLPAGMDPADYFLSHTLEEFARDDRVKRYNLTEALLAYLDSQDVSDSRKIYEASSLLSYLSDPLKRFEVMKRVAEHYDFPISSLSTVIKSVRTYGTSRMGRPEPGTESVSPQLLLATIIDGRSDFREKFIEEISRWDVELPSSEEDIILFRVAEGESLSEVLAEINGDYEERVLSIDLDESNLDLAFEDALKYFYRRVLMHNISVLKRKLKELRKKGEDPTLVIREINSLKKKLLSFSA